ncbi:MAG TPA: hypothetical protein VF212_16380 [Longimicrobiales bacterium]
MVRQQGSAAGGRGARLQCQMPDEIAAEAGPVPGWCFFGFSNDVTGKLTDEMRSFEFGYGFAPTRLWQLIPPADTLIVLE